MQAGTGGNASSSWRTCLAARPVCGKWLLSRLNDRLATRPYSGCTTIIGSLGRVRPWLRSSNALAIRIWMPSLSLALRAASAAASASFCFCSVRLLVRLMA